MRVIWKALIAGTFVITAGTFVIAAVAVSRTSPRRGPVFTKYGDLVLPTGFREWVFMGAPITPNRLNNGEAPFPEFHDVYIERQNLLYYQHHGYFPEGTVLVKELALTQNGKYPDGSLDSASGRGYFPSKLHGIDVMVKDSKRFANTNKWGFFTFGHQAPPYSPNARVKPAAQCASCHIAGVAKTDMVWVQYYPLLRAKMQ